MYVDALLKERNDAEKNPPLLVLVFAYLDSETENGLPRIGRFWLHPAEPASSPNQPPTSR